MLIPFEEACDMLSVSAAAGRNWVKLGKLSPARKEGRKLWFLQEDINKILQDIACGESSALRRRRNKRKIHGLSVCESYVSSPRTIDFVNRVIAEYKDKMNPFFLRAILAHMAIQFVCQENGAKASGNVLNAYLKGALSIGPYGALIDDLLGDKSGLLNAVDITAALFSSAVEYVPGEDSLGFVYISLVSAGDRKASGAYYTPPAVANQLVAHVSGTTDLSGKYIFDPCCGSGNFLLAIGQRTNTLDHIYGQDIDLTAVTIARIRFALKFGVTDLDFLHSHFVCGDTLEVSPRKGFDIVLGNPPWGGTLPKERVASLSGKYQTTSQSGAETYGLFMERGISLLAENGMLAFVLPEAILTVAAHTAIRKMLIRQCNFAFIRYLGNAFGGIHCPSILLGAQKTADKRPGVRTVYPAKSDESYAIHSNRQITATRFNFHIRDEAQDCVDAINGLSGLVTLAGNAAFALGIVTGDNAKHVSAVHHEGHEPVLRGSDIKKYRFGPGRKYIRFVPENFQQVAPAALYRAPEKLFYRFICESLVFAYDNQQTLSLNSCNIVIPQVPNMDIKYILAVLNSRAANFYFISVFHSVKVLRSHIEQIPIPPATAVEQKSICQWVDKIARSEKDISVAYNELDDHIMSLYGLDSAKRQTILSALAGRNLFLS